MAFVRIPRVRCPGAPALENWCNQVADALEQALNHEIVFGNNLTGWKDARSTVIDAQPGGSGDDSLQAGANGPYPFDVSVTANDAGDDSGAEAKIYPGLLNGLVPENVLETIDVDAGDLLYVFVRGSSDGQSMQSCEIMISSDYPDENNQPTKNALPDKCDVIVALIDFTAPATYVPYRAFFPKTDITLNPIEVYRTSRDSAEPGGLSYDIYYQWQILGSELQALGFGDE